MSRINNNFIANKLNLNYYEPCHLIQQVSLSTLEVVRVHDEVSAVATNMDRLQSYYEPHPHKNTLLQFFSPILNVLARRCPSISLRAFLFSKSLCFSFLFFPVHSLLCAHIFFVCREIVYSTAVYPARAADDTVNTQ
jgi:hypothetical protein